MAKKKHRKSTQKEVQERVLAVAKFLMQGVSRADIVEYCANNFDVTARQGDEYISKAKELIESEFEVMLPVELQRAAMRLDDLYKRAMNIQDYKTALSVIKERNALFGLHAPQKIHQTGNMSYEINFVYPESD